jgi:hypothetical protein
MRILATITMMLMLVVVAGCSEKSTTPELTEPVQSVAEEMPADVLEVMEANTPTEFDLAPADGQGGPTWPNIDFSGDYDVYAVTFLWGQFFDMTHQVEPTDWSGTLSVNGVAKVHPRRTIHFEPETDSLLPSDIEAAAAWVSYTGHDFDGINFLVFLDRTVTYITAPTLTFDTEPIVLEYSFDQLVRMDEFHLLDGGNAIGVHARKIWPQRCPGGFLEGTWLKADNSGANGTIEGLWLNMLGEPTGYLSGIFSTDSEGHRIIEGSVSGYVTDHVIAEFKGTWWYDDRRMCITCGQGHGWFRAHFVSADGSERRGRLSGEIGNFHSPTDSELELPIHGVWHDYCPWDHVDTDGRGLRN